MESPRFDGQFDRDRLPPEEAPIVADAGDLFLFLNLLEVYNFPDVCDLTVTECFDMHAVNDDLFAIISPGCSRDSRTNLFTRTELFVNLVRLVSNRQVLSMALSVPCVFSAPMYAFKICREYFVDIVRIEIVILR